MCRGKLGHTGLRGSLVHRESRSQRPDLAVEVANVGACGASGRHLCSRGCLLGCALAWCPEVEEVTDVDWCCDERQGGPTCGGGPQHLVPVMTAAIFGAWGQRSLGPWRRQQ